MRKYVPRSILKGETRPNFKNVPPSIICNTPIEVAQGIATIPTFANVQNAPAAFTLILEEDSFGRIQTHSIILNNGAVTHIKQRVEEVVKDNNGESHGIFTVDTVGAFIVISAPDASFLRCIPLDGSDYEESAHVHLGLFTYPDPRGTSYASDLNFKLSPSLDNKVSVLTSYIAPYEDRTSESINRAIDSIANNTENAYLSINDDFYKVVQVKVDTTHGNDDLLAFIQSSNFSNTSIVPILRRNATSWVRSIKSDAIVENFGKFSENASRLDIVGYMTNIPLYIHNRFHVPVNIAKTSDFSEIYNASRAFIEENVVPSDPEGNIGFNTCSNTTKIFTNKDILLGGEKSLESYFKIGKTDDLFGSEADIRNPMTFWIASADIEQSEIDNALNHIANSSEEEVPALQLNKQFSASSRIGWVSYPGTLYGTKAMSGSFKCLDRCTIRYMNSAQEKLPAFISEGMLLTNGIDAYEIESVVDQKTLLLRPINDYADILLGDVSLLQRKELTPNLTQNFDFYFGKTLTSKQIAMFATKPISVESIINSQRSSSDLAPNRLLPGDDLLDIGVITRIKNSRLSNSTSDNQNDSFKLEETIGTIDKRLALFNKFLQTAVGHNIPIGQGVSPISLESLACNSSSTRSPFKSNTDYLTNPTSIDKLFNDLPYNTIPQVLCESAFRKNSTSNSLVNVRNTVYESFKEFEIRIVSRVKKFCNLCFVNKGTITNSFIDEFTVDSWRNLVKSIEVGSVSVPVLRDLLGNEQIINLPGVTLPQSIKVMDLWFKQLCNLVYLLLNHYGYTSNLVSNVPRRYFETSSTPLGQTFLYQNLLQQCFNKMSSVYNCKHLGGGIVQLIPHNESVYEHFNIKDLGKPFVLCYLHTSAGQIPYIKQARVYMDEWINASCARFSFEGLDSTQIESLYSNNCLITYASGDIKSNLSISTVLNKATNKAEIIAQFANDSVLLSKLPEVSRVAHTYTIETSYSSVFVGENFTYVFMPSLNAFKDDCKILTTLPRFIGCNINIDLVTATYDIMEREDLSNIATLTSPESFLLSHIQPFFNVDYVSESEKVLRITPKQNIGVTSVYLDIKIATPNGHSISKVVACTRTCVNYDGTVFFKIPTVNLIDQEDVQSFRELIPSTVLDSRAETTVSFNNITVSRLEVNDPGVNGTSQLFINTLPALRTSLANTGAFFGGALTSPWYSVRGINIHNYVQPAITHVLVPARVTNDSVERGVLHDNVNYEKLANAGRIKLDILPSTKSFKAGQAPQDHISIESDNDSTAISVVQKTSIAQAENVSLYKLANGGLNDIKSGILIKTEPRSSSSESLEPLTEHPQLYRTFVNKLSQPKTRQAGVSAISVVNDYSNTPAILGVASQSLTTPSSPEADNFAIGAVSAISRVDNQTDAQTTVRPLNASLQANQNVILDDIVIYEGSDNVASGNARTNWRGTGFKRIGGRATSLNTITSARQPDLNTPFGNSRSYQSAHVKLVNGKFFKYVDSHNKLGPARGRGFSSANVSLVNGKSGTFKDLNNVGIKYENLPNYVGENDILFSYEINGPSSYSVNLDSENGQYTGSFSLFNIFSTISSSYVFSRLSDASRPISVRFKFGEDSYQFLQDLVGTGFSTGKLPNTQDTADLDWTGDNLYAEGFLLDSLITDDMVKSYRDYFGYETDSQAYDVVLQHATGQGDPLSNWLANAKSVEIIIHGREWNANIHSLVVSGGMFIGNNFIDRTLSILVDKERTSALINVHRGSLNLSASDDIHLASNNITGAGVTSLQKSISSTSNLELGLARDINLMMLPIRPVLQNRNIVGATQQQIRSMSDAKTLASLYFVAGIDDYIVPETLESPNESFSTSFHSTASLTDEQKDAIVASRKNILDFKIVSSSARIVRPETPGKDMFVVNPESWQPIVYTNTLNEQIFAVSRDEHNYDDMQDYTEIGKKYLILDLADYLTHEKDETISYLKSYVTFDIASEDDTITSEIGAARRNDIANSFQKELNTTSESINYDLITNDVEHPQGIIRAFSTADSYEDDVDYSFSSPLNISKLESRCLISKKISDWDDFLSIKTIFYTQDYDKELSRYLDNNTIFHIRQFKGTGAPTFCSNVVSRYGCRSYIRPVIYENKWAYVMEIPFKNLIITVKLNTVIIDGVVYPSTDYSIANNLYQQSSKVPGILSSYKKDCINNTVNFLRKDIDGNTCAFPRPCITWINAHAEFLTHSASNFGQLISVQIQPSHYMPTWIDRHPLRPGVFDYYKRNQFTAGYNFIDIAKFLRTSTEIVIRSVNSVLNPLDIQIPDTGSILSKGYNSQKSATRGFVDKNSKVWQFNSEPDYNERAYSFINNHLMSNNFYVISGNLYARTINDILASGVILKYKWYKKSVIGVQNANMEKVTLDSDGNLVDTPCDSTNRAYYNLLNRFDFLDPARLDGEFNKLADITFWYAGDDSRLGQLNEWLLNTDANDDSLQNIGEFIRAFLALGVDVCRLYRMKNIGMTSPSSQLDSDASDFLSKSYSLLSDVQLLYPDDTLDTRKYGIVSTLTVPHVVKFTRK